MKGLRVLKDLVCWTRKCGVSVCAVLTWLVLSSTRAKDLHIRALSGSLQFMVDTFNRVSLSSPSARDGDTNNLTVGPVHQP